MKPREIRDGVYWVGAVDWDRRLFDCLIPLPDGTSYNAYLIKGSNRTALIDTVDTPMWQKLIDNLNQLGVDSIDYVIANHAEPDHSGAIPHILEKYPGATLLATPRCKDILVDLLMVPKERISTVNDRETVSLGDRTLEFIHIPWVHWPETMGTYLREEKILFPCDFFGSHLATTDLYVTDQGRVHEAAKRYYAEIMMPFRSNIQKNLAKLKDYAIDIIAPSHGPLYDNPDFIMEAYQHWADDKPKNHVVVAYVSMYGSTRRMVEYLVAALAEKGISVEQFDLTVADLGKLAMALVDAATLVIGTPTVLTGPHPAAAYAAIAVNALRPKLRYISVIGSYGWGGKSVEQLSSMIPNLKAEILEPVLSKGAPLEADFKALENLVTIITTKHKESDFDPVLS
jgi:flavorubredoxin